ncbi:MAG: EAL domain-containing protein [Lachnospiraceae bacterium]|nr:EAL domain-containing protein [Lachnospiraceae bacterium]
MAVRKRIALLLGQAEEFYQYRFIDGFLRQTFDADLDVCIFSMYLKYQDTEAREKGDKRIYSLVNFSLFDAVVVLPDTIQTPGMAGEIEDRIKAEFDGPVLYVDLASKTFPYILTDSYTPVKQLIEHLVQVHGYRDIAFLTGKKWHEHSKIRLQAYRDVMTEAGLTVREDRVFYGDYWYTGGKKCAEKLLKNRDDLPEAVACANDFMAIGLCEELAAAGLKVPEDIAVIGFDTSDEGQRSPKPLTSAYIPARATGARAARSILRLMKGGSVDESKDETELFIGTSCGCVDDGNIYNSLRRESWTTVLSEEGFYSLHNHFVEDMIAQKDTRGFLDTVYSHVYQLKDIDSFHLCIPKDWADPSLTDDDTMTASSYPTQMVRVLASYRGSGRVDRVGQTESFSSLELLPELYEEHDTPCSYIFTPLYFGARNFGYAVISYGNLTRSYDEIYRLWILAFCSGLESLRRTLIMKAIRRSGVLAKFPSGFTGDITREDEEAIECVSRILDDNLFTYHFQPIVSAVDGSIYAFEALMRANTEKKISPLDIIKYADMLRRLHDVEKATFINVLEHLREKEEDFGDRHVFINSIPGTKLSEEDEKKIEALLIACGGQAVVELTEQAELDDEALSAMKARYSDMGIGTAVDDYGTGYSNVSNLLRYMPDYVKVDRSLLSGIQDSPSKQHFVREIVSFSHDNGIKVLAEGVETADELRTVIGLGCDLIQGYYTGRPSPEILQQIKPEIMEEICRYQKEHQEGTNRRGYKAGRVGRISAGSLVRDGYQKIVTTGEEVSFRDYVLSGTPGQKTELTIEVQEGYDGQITLENVSLVSPKLKPCIEVAPGAKVALMLRGENNLIGGGIMIPEGAELTVFGDGDLTIRMKQGTYAAVGMSNGKAGRIEFYQDGTILIETRGAQGVAIGGSDGADVHIYRGRYVIQQNSDQAVAIGSLDSDVKLDINKCEMHLAFSGNSGVGLGSLNGNADVAITKTYYNCTAEGEEYAVCGSCGGSRARVSLKDLSMDMDINATCATGAGALKGSSEIIMDLVSFRYTGKGAQNYAYGGITGEGSFESSEEKITANISNDAGCITMISD